MKLVKTIKRFIYWDFVYPFKNSFNILKNFVNFIYGLYQWSILSRKKNIKLDLGSGERGKNGFTTVALEKGDLCWDLRRGIP